MTQTSWLPGHRDPRLLQVVPVAGNLPLGANHPSEHHHPGLNVTVKLGKTVNDVRHGRCGGS